MRVLFSFIVPLEFYGFFMTLSRTSSIASIASLDNSQVDCSVIPENTPNALMQLNPVNSPSAKVDSKTVDMKAPIDPQSPRQVALKRLTAQLKQSKVRAECVKNNDAIATPSQAGSSASSVLHQNLDSLIQMRLDGQTSKAHALANKLIVENQPQHFSTSSLPLNRPNNQARAEVLLSRLAAVKKSALARQAQAEPMPGKEIENTKRA